MKQKQTIVRISHSDGSYQDFKFDNRDEAYAFQERLVFVHGFDAEVLS